MGESIQRKSTCLTRRLSRSALRLRAGAPGHRDRVPRLVDYLLAVRARRAGKSNAAVVAAGSWRACGARQRGARVVHNPHRPLRLGVGVGGDHREHLAGAVRRALVATLALRPAAQDPSQRAHPRWVHVGIGVQGAVLLIVRASPRAVVRRGA